MARHDFHGAANFEAACRLEFSDQQASVFRFECSGGDRALCGKALDALVDCIGAQRIQCLAIRCALADAYKAIQIVVQGAEWTQIGIDA